MNKPTNHFQNKLLYIFNIFKDYFANSCTWKTRTLAKKTNLSFKQTKRLVKQFEKNPE